MIEGDTVKICRQIPEFRRSVFVFMSKYPDMEAADASDSLVLIYQITPHHMLGTFSPDTRRLPTFTFDAMFRNAQPGTVVSGCIV